MKLSPLIKEIGFRDKASQSVDTVTGPYDIIAIVEAKNLNEIGDLVTGKVHPIAGISRTVTCLAIGGS